MILVVGGLKGGCGKTTIATNLCQIRSEKGKKVLLIDADDQKSSYEWSMQRDINSSLCKSQFVTICLTGKSVYTNINKMSDDYDDIIVDTGGRDTTSQRAAMSACDKFLIPFRPRSLDIWTVGTVRNIIDECCNNNMKSYAIINQADFVGKDNEDSYEILKECEEITTLPFFIGNRKSFSVAASNGLGVLEVNPKDVKACREIGMLYEYIYE